MNILGVIPARLQSTRLPRKVLREIAGLPMVVYVFRRAQSCRMLSDLLVATDSEEVIEACHTHHIPAVLTSPDHQSGTDRLWEVSRARVAVVAAVGEARADRIALRGGGQIRGKVLPDPQHPDRWTILTETGKTPLNFQKAQVLQVQAEPSALDEYLARRDQVAPTAAAQFDFGLWCEQHKLKDLARVHYEAALNQDKSFAPAHQKLSVRMPPGVPSRHTLARLRANTPTVTTPGHWSISAWMSESSRELPPGGLVSMYEAPSVPWPIF